MRHILIYIIAITAALLFAACAATNRHRESAHQAAPSVAHPNVEAKDSMAGISTRPLAPLDSVIEHWDEIADRMRADSLEMDSLIAEPDKLAALADSVATKMFPTKFPIDSLMAVADSLKSIGDTLRYDSLMAVVDSLKKIPVDLPKKERPNPFAVNGPSRIRKEKVDLDAQVTFSSSDSMIVVRRDSAYMYGKGNVVYGDLKLDADNIQMDLTKSTVFAVGTTDSVGNIIGKPIFNEKGTDYEAATMEYNFKTKKGFITNVVTQQGEGYVSGGTTKKGPDNDYFLKDAKYTTCDDHDCPHFYFQMTKAKMVPGKNVVMGPAYMVLAGLPLPIAVPFGFFPFTDKYSSGVIVPTFGDDYNRGFYLSDGGYYFAISDNIDLSLTGEIYTKGSWGLRAQSSYTKRYKYNGSFNVSYLKSIYGEKGSPDYSASTNFQILWSHSQDSKANPNMSLSASVNFTTSGYTRNNLGSYYSSAFTENTKSSTVNMTYRFPNSKWSVSTTMNISQRTQDSTLAVSFPNFTVTMSQVYPFKRKKAVGDEKWYEKIKISYSGQFQNSLTAKQDEFFKKSLIKDWRNGMKHSMPISATFNVAKYINITPSISLTDRMYTTKVKRHWDEVNGIEACDTTYSLYNVWDFTASVSLDTKIYGFFQPLPFLGNKVKMIRHVLTPTISFNASPDFGSPFFGYYGRYMKPQSDGTYIENVYSMFPNSLYGVPSQGKTGSVSVSLANNLEMKVRSSNDSVSEDKKISLIENLTLSQSYNFAADSLRLSDLSTSMLLRLTKGFNLNLSATWDVYTYALNSYGNPVRVNKLRIASGKGYGRLRSTGTSFSYNFNNDTFKKLFGKGKDKDKKGKGDEDEDDDNWGDDGMTNNRRNQRKEKEEDVLNDDGYLAWSVPWNLSVNYSINYGYGSFNKEKLEYDGKVTQNLSFSGNIRPTKNWNFSFSCSYNFDTHKIAYMNCNLSRDLHCFTMTASFVPVGPYKSYNFHIAVKSSLLSDFKYDKRSSRSNGVTWY
ncbi:MAG: LPS-assembly protein LptD [Bacteroidales bacterium]|nr:LPS-assembly protein LptD [Bacteroidales bacterium]